jgi:hypothetical protein
MKFLIEPRDFTFASRFASSWWRLKLGPVARSASDRHLAHARCSRASTLATSVIRPRPGVPEQKTAAVHPIYLFPIFRAFSPTIPVSIYLHACVLSCCDGLGARALVWCEHPFEWKLL